EAMLDRAGVGAELEAVGHGLERTLEPATADALGREALEGLERGDAVGQVANARVALDPRPRDGLAAGFDRGRHNAQLLRRQRAICRARKLEYIDVTLDEVIVTI